MLVSTQTAECLHIDNERGTNTIIMPNLIKIERLLKSRRAINLNNKLARILGFDSMRELFASIHQWGYTRDFTYLTYQDEDMQTFLRKYLRETYLDDN